MLIQTRRNKIKSQQNEKIIQLIKQKLNPLSTKKRFFPKIYNKFQVKLDCQAPSILTTLNQFHIDEKQPSYEKQLKKKLRNIQIVKKVKIHIEEKKKLIPQQTYQQLRYNLPQISLGDYIDLFSKPQKTKVNKNIGQITKFLRESVTTNLFDNIQVKQKENQKELSQDEICLMNAKIRKQQNHKKMISTIKLKRKLIH